MRKHARWMCLTAALLVACAGLWLANQQGTALATDPPRSPQPAGAGASPAAPETAQSVTVVRPRLQNMARYLNVPATLNAYEEADLYAKTSGYIAEVRVDIGDRVRHGDVLAVIDVPEMIKDLAEARSVLAAANAAVQMASSAIVQANRALDVAENMLVRERAELALHETILQRRNQLFLSEAITQEQLDEAQNEVDVARAGVSIAEARIAAAQADVAGAEAAHAAAVANVGVARARVERTETLLQYAQIVAPFDGVVTRRLVDRGALVQSALTNRTMPLFTVHRTDRLRLAFDAPESDIAFIRPGCSAKIRPYGLADVEINGTIARVASALNPQTRTMRAEIDLPNDCGTLMSGMYAHIEIEIDQQAGALTIPANSLLTEDGETFVYTVAESRAQRTPVRLGLDDGIRVQVLSGLKADAQVIVTGKGLVAQGSLLRPVPMEEPS